jgi:hypothetical protein
VVLISITYQATQELGAKNGYRVNLQDHGVFTDAGSKIRSQAEDSDAIQGMAKRSV